MLIMPNELSVMGSHEVDLPSGISGLLPARYFRHQHAVTLRRRRESLQEAAGRNHPQFCEGGSLHIGMDYLARRAGWPFETSVYGY